MEDRRRPGPAGYVGVNYAPTALVFDSTPINAALPPAEITLSDEMRAAALVSQARDQLASTDYVVIRVTETGAMLAPAWLTWRKQLREVVRGVRTEIPEEPPRYANAPL